MKRILILFAIGCMTLTSIAQANKLSVLRRDSLLTEAVQKVLRNKFPDCYRENVHPDVWQGDFQELGVEWNPALYGELPPDLQWEDTCYHVTLYYDKWQEEGFKQPYTAYAQVIGKSMEIFNLSLGGHSFTGLDWSVLQTAPDVTRLSQLPPKQKREKITRIAEMALIKDTHEWDIRECRTSIEEGDFKVLDLQWLPQHPDVPPYATAKDLYYKVTFYDTRWNEKKLNHPAIVEVYLIDSTGDVYDIIDRRDLFHWVQYEEKLYKQKNK